MITLPWVGVPSFTNRKIHKITSVAFTTPPGYEHAGEYQTLRHKGQTRTATQGCYECAVGRSTKGERSKNMLVEWSTHVGQRSLKHKKQLWWDSWFHLGLCPLKHWSLGVVGADVTGQKSYGIDSTSTKSEGKYYIETLLMIFVGSLCWIQLAIIGVCLRTDIAHTICSLVSFIAIKRAWGVCFGSHPCISMLLSPYQRFFQKDPRACLVIGYFAFANECKNVTELHVPSV